MTFKRVFTTTSAIALLSGPALADVTAQDVWTDWQDLLARYGAEITTSSQTQSGGTLTVSGLSAAFSIEEGDMTLNIGDISFAEQGDGTVLVTMPDTMPFDMNFTDPDGKTGKVGFTMSQPGGALVASGDPDNMRYDFDYPTMSISDFTIEGDDVPEDLPLAIDMVASGVTGFMALQAGDVRSYESESTVASIAMNMSFEDPAEGSGSFRLSMSDLTQAVRGAFPDIEMDMSAAALAMAGLSQTGTGTYGPSTFEFAADGPDGAMEMAAAAEGGTIDVNFGMDGLNYGGVTNGITMTVGGSAIPFPMPLTFAMEKSEGRIIMPMVPNPDTAQEFGLVMTLEGLEIDNILWNMFDPAEQLPRDPATLVVDLGGSVILTEDFTSPEYAESMEAAPPGTIESLDINAIEIKLAGAELTGDGDFAFDNSMGMPVPSGTANLMLTGGNTLLDTLVGMGLIPEDQAMGARMMLGLFARPGDGPDTLVSTIEVNEDGSILANGQRIK